MKKWLLLTVLLFVVTGAAQAIPDPSAVYCILQGYDFEIRTDEQGGQYGVCVFPDGSECSTWHYYCKCEPNGITCWPGGDFNCHWPCKQMRCKEAGESVLVSTCCEGLDELYPPHIFDANCNKLQWVGWLFLCSECGNGICEDWESRCNCHEDCAQPRIIYVDDDAAGNNDGSGWSDAFNDLQDALDFALPGDEIRVAQGVYSPEVSLSPTMASNPNPADEETRVSLYISYLSWTAGSDATSHDVYFGTSYPPPFVCNQTSTTFDTGMMAYYTTYYWRIDEVNKWGKITGKVWSFTTFGGPGPSSSPPPPLMGWSDGEAVTLMSDSRMATFQLKNGVVIKGGYAGFDKPDPNARDIELYETILSGDLDGNDVDVSDPYDLLTEPTRAENSYHVVTAIGTDETAVLDGFTITSGNANGWYAHNYGGAGMYNYMGSPTVTNCKFSWNSATNDGGGMANRSSNPTLTNCKFTGNLAGSESPLSGGGGMVNHSGSSPTLINCIFSGNCAWRGGGGMHNLGSSPTMTNCTLSGNHAQLGGGISILIPPGGHKQGGVVLTNCILWGNLPNEIDGIATVSYSNIHGGWLGHGNLDADPLFVDSAIGDYHLSEFSPCINAGDPNYVAEANETDLDGKPRVIGSRIDMGAYEYCPPIPAEVRIVPHTINLESKGKWIAAFLWLREDYKVADIDANSVYLEGEIKPELFWIAEDNQVAIAKFSREELRDILSIGDVELTVTGRLNNGIVFEGMDTIKLIVKGGANK